MSEGREFETSATIKIDSFSGPMGSVDRCCHVAGPPLLDGRISPTHRSSKIRLRTIPMRKQSLRLLIAGIIAVATPMNKNWLGQNETTSRHQSF